MAKVRRDPADYDPEVDRFEDWLESTEDMTLIKIEDIEELVEHLESWFVDELELDRKTWVGLARPMVRWMIESRKLSPRLLRPARVVRVKKRIRLLRSGQDWERWEEGRLRYRYQRPEKFSVKEIAQDIGRSERSVYIKAHKLKIKRKG